MKYGLVLNQTVWQQIITDFQQPVLERKRSCQSLRFQAANWSTDDTLDNKIMIFDMFGYKKVRLRSDQKPLGKTWRFFGFFLAF